MKTVLLPSTLEAASLGLIDLDRISTWDICWESISF